MFRFLNVVFRLSLSYLTSLSKCRSVSGCRFCECRRCSNDGVWVPQKNRNCAFMSRGNFEKTHSGQFWQHFCRFPSATFFANFGNIFGSFFFFRSNFLQQRSNIFAKNVARDRPNYFFDALQTAKCLFVAFWN